MPPTTLCSVIMASTNESFIGNQSPDQNQLKDLLFLTAPLRPGPCQKQSTWTDGSQTERLSESLFYENLGSDKNMYIYGMCAGGLP